MIKISDPLAIALWITGASWLVALISYVLDEREVIVPVIVLRGVDHVAKVHQVGKSKDQSNASISASAISKANMNS